MKLYVLSLVSMKGIVVLLYVITTNNSPIAVQCFE